MNHKLLTSLGVHFIYVGKVPRNTGYIPNESVVFLKKNYENTGYTLFERLIYKLDIF